MKANGAPEKIYISTNSQDGTFYVSNQYKRLIEYTRTDAFIDKAATWFANRYQVNGSCLNANDIEDFIKYMKGENE